MSAFIFIPVGFTIASGWWLWNRGAKAGYRMPGKIVLAILGVAMFNFGQYGVNEFLKENFQRQLWYYLTHYPDAYTIIAIFCITFMLVLVADWILGKTLKGGQAKSEV